MSVVRFGIYYRQHATERDVFEVGDVPILKGYDFGDVDFESGDLLSFVLEGGALVAASNAAFEDPEAFRELLPSADDHGNSPRQRLLCPVSRRWPRDFSRLLRAEGA